MRKLYPGHLIVDIVERVPYALWQKDGKLSLIAADGTVLGARGSPLRRAAARRRSGARRRRRGTSCHPVELSAFRDTVRASILVADRRWNLKLVNGIDIRLPETNIAAALETLLTLDRDKKLLTRDITAVDLRLADRVNVRLSDTAAQARDDAMKIRKPKAKGGNA